MNKSIQNAVLGYLTKESTGDKLPAGHHSVTVSDCRVLHSRVKWDGDPKTDLPQFSDATPQLGVEFRDESGAVAWHRFNMWGYKRWEELPVSDQASDKYEKVIFGSTVYACEVQGDKLFRVRDAKRTADAQSIVDQFIASVDMTGNKLGDVLDTLVSEEIKLVIKIEDDEYLGKAQLRVTSFEKQRELIDEFGG